MSILDLLRGRLFQRLPKKHQLTCRVVINDLTVIHDHDHDHDRDRDHYVLAYHSSAEDSINSILNEGFITRLKDWSGNKGAGVYFATHSSYPLLWGGPHFLLCKIFLDPEHVNVFRSELPPGFELTVTNNQNIVPLFKINAELQIINPTEFEYSSNYLQLFQTGCPECDRVGRRCDCKLPHSVLNDLIADDQNFINLLTDIR